MIIVYDESSGAVITGYEADGGSPPDTSSYSVDNSPMTLLEFNSRMDSLISPVFDPATGEIREGASLAEAQAAKKSEMDAAFASECESTFASVYIAIALLVAGESSDSRLVAAEDYFRHWQDKYAQIDACSTVSEAKAVTW